MNLMVCLLCAVLAVREAIPMPMPKTESSKTAQNAIIVFPTEVQPTRTYNRPTKSSRYYDRRGATNAAVTAATTTPSTTTTDEDYYDDILGDQAVTVGKISPTSPPSRNGCPDLHAVCRHSCEKTQYYSGYCDGEVCTCFGKL